MRSCASQVFKAKWGTADVAVKRVTEATPRSLHAFKREINTLCSLWWACCLVRMATHILHQLT